ncbi:hypothetical protein AK812_SmicGene13798 [Symbiodinium microadriaticum]|uniref:CCHC-type domain-containing protein n=1 Tax=Symbiodinium microadriaticum TaxID=2951 RepID=A0A1Q9E754_SYMMI|nr:hypothetical protein AK812_SmicGene13798 [Symbiodinium microadriaticum]
MSMERMLPKMYKDLLGIVSVLWMVWYPHQVVAEESLCHLDIRPQPYSLKEEVGSPVWEYPTVPLQWKTDQSKKSVWKQLLNLEQKRTRKNLQLASNLQQELWNFSMKVEMKHLLQVKDTRRSSSFPKWTEEKHLGHQLSAQAARKEEKRNKRAEKSARKAEKAEAEKHEEKPEEISPKTPVRRKLAQRDPSHRPNFYFILDRLISNLRHIPRTVFAPPAGEAERIQLEKLREEEEEAEDAEAAKKATAGMEEGDEGSASRKRKLDELEEKKRVLEEENSRRKQELEEEARRIRAVEEAERRAREQRSKNPKMQVPMASEKTEKGETWFERKATELVESYIQAYGPQQKKSKEAAATYASACKDSERAQENFVSALQKTQESAEALQRSMGQALEAAIEFGREEERAQLYTQARTVRDLKYLELKQGLRSQLAAGLQEKIRKEKTKKDEESSKSGKKEGPGVPTSTQPGPFWGARARVQPAEEEPGKEWRERISEDTWKVGRTLKSDEKYLECTYYPFSPEWQEKLRKELLDLAHRGFATSADGELYPTRRFGWQLQSTREFESINKSLERDYGVRLVWKSQEVKGKSKSVDDWHCFPLGRGKMEKTTRFGVQYTILGSLPPNKSMCSICWSEGHWKSECPHKEMVFELWEPALCVLVPSECLRRYHPCRNIVCERFQHEKDDYQRFYPAVAFADYGAVSSQISEINSKRYKDAKLRSPEEYPEIEPPADERGERPVLTSAEATPYAVSKKAAKPSDPEQSMASHSEALLEMQDSAKKCRAKQLEKESKRKAIDVDEESTGKKEESAEKKARGKGQGSPGIWAKESLPAGHWQDRPRRESLPSDSKEAKEALRQKLEEHKKEQLEEYHKKKLRETFETHLKKGASSKGEEPAVRTGPGPDEAGSDPSSSEESESSSSSGDDME